jgi:hypothetical protein
MPRQKKKYRVNTFEYIAAQLRALGSQPYPTAMSTHYYAKRAGNGIVKLIELEDGSHEIHILKEKGGKYTLIENIPVKNKEEGLDWLDSKGYSKLQTITMSHTDYPYQDGIVGLYVINGVLYSVILTFPPGKHEAIERKFGLQDAEVIDISYNKYLEQHKLG